MNGALWVELSGELIIARLRGEPTAKLARLAFGEGDYRVFFNDIAAAVKWLTETPAAARLTRVK